MVPALVQLLVMPRRRHADNFPAVAFLVGVLLCIALLTATSSDAQGADHVTLDPAARPAPGVDQDMPVAPDQQGPGGHDNEGHLATAQEADQAAALKELQRRREVHQQHAHVHIANDVDAAGHFSRQRLGDTPATRRTSAVSPPTLRGVDLLQWLLLCVIFGFPAVAAVKGLLGPAPKR
jgi:hypothetical protein